MPVPLAQVVRRRDNPFRQENAALGLTAALLATITRPEHREVRASWGLLNLEVGCNRWHDPQHPDAVFEIAVVEDAPADPRNVTPDWCRADMAWAYALGRILRACIVGDPDFTARGFLIRDEQARYRGLSSTWFKRRLGLLNTPEGLLGEPAPLSPWLVDLIMVLLQWPGVHPADGVIADLARVETPEQLALLIAGRRGAQRRIYGFQSGLPMYVRPASRGQAVNRALWLLRHERDGSREIIRVQQGKGHMTKVERAMGVTAERPYQVLIELTGPAGARYRLAGVICYDATDLSLAADLRDRSDCLVIAALNKDVPTFDAMVQALNYHMFQPVIVSNSGEFGGSTAQAPYRERHEKVIAHVHGSGQVAVSVFEIDLAAFRSKQREEQPAKAIKTKPAGYRGRPG